MIENLNGRSAVTVLACVLLAAAAWLGVTYSQDGLPSDFALRYQPGVSHDYGLNMNIETKTHTGVDGDAAQQLVGALRVRGTIVLTGMGKHPESGLNLVSFQLAKTDDIDFVVQGVSIPISPESLMEVSKAEAVVAMSDLGRVQSLSFPPSTPLYVQQVLRPVVMEMQTVLQTERSQWQEKQQRYAGRESAGYQFVAAGAKAYQLRRTPLKYAPFVGVDVELQNEPQSMRGGSDVSLHKDGYLHALSVDEQISVEKDAQRMWVHLRLQARHIGQRKQSVRNLNLAQLKAMETLGPEVVPGEKLALENALRDRIGGLTYAKLTAHVRTYSGFKDANHRRWFYGAVGLLLQDPALCAQLAEDYFSEGVFDDGHNLIMDLLAAAGHSEAQAALRTILADNRAQADENFARLVQSTTLLRHPNLETVEFLGGLSETLRHPTKQASATISFGAGIGKLVEQGDDAGAQVMNDKLTAVSEGARTTPAKRGALYALGNAGLDANLGVIQAIDDNGDVNTRAVRARALRKLGSKEARTSLREMTRGMRVFLLLYFASHREFSI